MKTRQDYERTLASIGEVIRSWDPYALVREGAPQDEFDAEIAKLATHVPTIRTAEDAARAVSSVFSSAFGPEDFDVDSCREVGRLLVERLEGMVCLWLPYNTAVRRIPRGRVATYGQVARLVGLNGLARQVGYALNALPDHTTVPWHRVINARGGISCRRVFGAEIEQRIRLEREGVRFNAAGYVSLPDFGWRTGTPKTRHR